MREFEATWAPSRVNVCLVVRLATNGRFLPSCNIIESLMLENCLLAHFLSEAGWKMLG
jgi:hypothetical protein